MNGVGWDVDPIVAAWPGRPALTEDVSADACVVGLGASGLAAIRELTRRGLSVVGLDAGRIAAGAAGRNGGFLLGGAAASVHDAVVSMGADDAEWLYRQTLAELDDLAAQLGPDVVRRVGSIRLAGLPGARDETELADCDRQAEVLRQFGIAVGRYDGPLGEGLYLPDDAATNPALRALALAAPMTGLYENSPVIAIESGLVRTAGATVRAGVVIVAVDGRLEQVLPQLADRVRTARLQMLATAPVQARLPCPVYARWGYDYAQQDADGRLYVGGGRDRFAEQEWTTDTTPTDSVQSHIEDVAVRLAGGPIRVTHRWAASVGYTPDGRPLVTEVLPGVIACGGYNGTGNLVGPVAARAAVALAVDGTRPRACFAD